MLMAGRLFMERDISIRRGWERSIFRYRLHGVSPRFMTPSIAAGDMDGVSEQGSFQVLSGVLLPGSSPRIGGTGGVGEDGTIGTTTGTIPITVSIAPSTSTGPSLSIGRGSLTDPVG